MPRYAPGSDFGGFTILDGYATAIAISEAGSPSFKAGCTLFQYPALQNLKHTLYPATAPATDFRETKGSAEAKPISSMPSPGPAALISCFNFSHTEASCLCPGLYARHFSSLSSSNTYSVNSERPPHGKRTGVNFYICLAYLNSNGTNSIWFNAKCSLKLLSCKHFTISSIQKTARK